MIGRFFAISTVLALIGACGGGDNDSDQDSTATVSPTVSAQEYMDAFERITDDLIEGVDSLDERADAVVADEDLDGLRSLYSQLVGSYDEAIEDLSGLVPPAELRDLHDEFLARVQAVREFERDGASIVNEATDWNDAIARISDRETAAYEDMVEVCVRLKDLATTALGLDANPSCLALN